MCSSHSALYMRIYEKWCFCQIPRWLTSVLMPRTVETALTQDSVCLCLSVCSPIRPSIFFIFSVYMCIYVGTCVPWHECGVQRQSVFVGTSSLHSVGLRDGPQSHESWQQVLLSPPRCPDNPQGWVLLNEQEICRQKVVEDLKAEK